ncbi:tRNA threonylcarbamoyl adenosine modification protein YeaZ [Nakamurella panacisegetis]|uniref:tRNA threonylcarbamoyl adenosine modification protein YeaZ n=1 Tax=Nakamurella panacisegetis TaxID=1090615 RepID=A0A1H0P386_9ACTN|nr:tRNA (adenosine(37)-N6)-threonylcarbamoyltransferase complex dimerization subunit type 1 TsaB [Nakamurella panacisegetis]SDO99482.1 tRNA threonylcarbamoyl adenosine modification protein YeaZ [Nakamurella panacisegetis]
MLLLAIDTSTPTVIAGVVSLLRPHELIGEQPPAPVAVAAERTVTGGFAHAEQLMPLVAAALAEAGHTLKDLDAVVVGLGPGPFTGLRVGIATAQALGDALDIPVHGVGSHDALARTYLLDGPVDGDFLVVTDARRREVYLSAYSAQGARRFGPAPIAPAAAPAALKAAAVAPTAMIGAGTGLLVDGPPAAPVAGRLSAGLVLAAAVALVTGVVPGPLTPLYLRRPDATEPGVRKSVLGP